MHFSGKRASVTLWTCLIMALIMLGALGSLFFQKVVMEEPRYKSRICPVMVFPEVHVYDVSTDTDSTIAVEQLKIHAAAYDSIKRRMELIQFNHEMLQKQHDKAIDDLRQETNNYINKVNGWLSFWIAASAILAILMPILIQYLNSRVERKNMHEHIRKLRCKLLELEEKMKKTRCDYERQKYLQETLHLVRIGIENSLLQPDCHRDDSLISHFWRSLHTHFVEMVGKEFRGNEVLTHDNIRNLQETLLYLFDYVRELQRIVPRYESRRFLTIADSISRLYRVLENREPIDKKQLKENFDSVLLQFNNLII